jgi:hypothetical protein
MEGVCAGVAGVCQGRRPGRLEFTTARGCARRGAHCVVLTLAARLQKKQSRQAGIELMTLAKHTSRT